MKKRPSAMTPPKHAAEVSGGAGIFYVVIPLRQIFAVLPPLFEGQEPSLAPLTETRPRSTPSPTPSLRSKKSRPPSPVPQKSKDVSIKPARKATRRLRSEGDGSPPEVTNNSRPPGMASTCKPLSGAHAHARSARRSEA